MFQTSALYVFYKKLGTQYSNFSIGIFQMKPSFIEDLEIQIKNDSNLAMFNSLAKYPNILTKESEREIRINRLKNQNWQILYLIAYVKFLDSIFKNDFDSKMKNSLINKIKVYSTAYNAGIFYNKEKIFKMMNSNFFPKGNEKFNYGEISYYFYQNYLIAIK